ncbi:unnamed protein product [Anisakis simplex]|uniref:Major facilitator superfamily (MFS) profile domain-containing protein n=1 Tax=Anisakis simplex TaxID=6269 RepID=A0A3P6QUI0_ANISI|nr:unnamed protein product [Anisakis simplex]
MYKNLDTDKLLNEVGQCGFYQIVSYVLCQLLNFPYAASQFIMPFIQTQPAAVCISSNGVDAFSWCSTKKVPKSLLRIDPSWKDKSMLVETDSILMLQFDLLCSNPIVQEAGFCIFSLGAMLIVPFVSQLADLYGRRTTLLVTLYLSVLFNIVAAFSPNYSTFVTLRFFIGAASDSYLTIASILSCEVVANESRPWTGLVYTITWLLGYLYVGCSCSHMTNDFQYITGITILADCSWTYNRYQKLYQTIKLVNLNERCSVFSLEDILRNQNVLELREIMVMSFYYYAISLDSVNLSDDKYTGYMLSGAIELPGGIIAIPLLRFFGRRSVTVLALTVQGIAISISPFVRRWHWARLIIDLSAKMVNGIAFVSHPLLVNEMMPTTIRTTSYSIINIPQSIGIMLSPLLKYTDLGDGKVPCLTLAFLSFVSALLTLTLPETKDKPMPEDFEQMDVGPLLQPFIRNRPLKKSNRITDITELSSSKSTTPSTSSSLI